MRALRAVETQMQTQGQAQVSLTDPDARSMKNRDGGIVGYNVQAAVDAEHHLIVAHEVVTDGIDRDQLAPMAEQARDATGIDALTVVADRGYFKSEQIRQCEEVGITPIVPKPLTSNAGAEGASTNATSSTSPATMSTAAPRASGRSSASPRSERPDDPQVLDLSLSAMPAEGALHHRRLSPHRALGA